MSSKITKTWTQNQNCSDSNKLQSIQDIYTQQDFWVIDISKSVTKYIASPLKCLRANDEQFSVTSYSTKLKSKYDYEKPNFPTLPHSEVSSETSETWYR